MGVCNKVWSKESVCHIVIIRETVCYSGIINKSLLQKDKTKTVCRYVRIK